MQFDLYIKRQPSDRKQTLGEMQVFHEGKPVYTCKTLELPWMNNTQQKSCIPTGSYTVVKRKSSKYGDHYHVLNVPGREYILIHFGNYHTDILGCILVGQAHQDINGDGFRDVTSSKVTMTALNKLMANAKSIKLHIS